MAWESLDINSDVFTTSNMIPGYKDAGSRQWAAKLAANTSYLYRNSSQNMFINEGFSENEEKDFDTERDYRNSFIRIQVTYGSSVELTFPRQFHKLFTVDGVELFLYGYESDPGENGSDWIDWLTQLTTDYQDFIGSTISIKALSTGGFRIKSTVSATTYIMGIITELRQIIGASV